MVVGMELIGSLTNIPHGSRIIAIFEAIFKSFCGKYQKNYE